VVRHKAWRSLSGTQTETKDYTQLIEHPLDTRLNGGVQGLDSTDRASPRHLSIMTHLALGAPSEMPAHAAQRAPPDHAAGSAHVPKVGHSCSVFGSDLNPA
jgi:hypothetical protein